MSKVRAALYHQQGYVPVEIGATKGARIGTDVYLADGTLYEPAESTQSEPITSASLGNITTDHLSEGGSNFWYTDARADARIALHEAALDPHPQYRNILPVVTGEVPAVLVCGPDGSLIYTAI